MRKYLLKALVVVAFGAMPVVAANPPVAFTVNGLKVIFAQSTATDIIAANMYFKGGSAILDVNKAGIEGFSLAVAREATKNFPKDKLSATLERMDTRIGSAAGRDYSSLTMQCVRQNFAESWKIFSDILLNPLFDSTDVELERQRILSGIRQSRDNPDQYLSNLAMKAFFVDHPYAEGPEGTERTVSAFSRIDLQSFMQRRRVTSEMLLVVVGNSTRDMIQSMVTTSFGSLPQGSYIGVSLPPVHHQAPSIKIVKRDLPTNYILGYCTAPAFGSEQSYAMSIAGSILGDRVFEEVRTKRGLSYAPSAGTGNLFNNFGMLYVTAVKPETTITVMLNEVRKLQEEPVSAKTLTDKRNVYLMRYYTNMETNQSQADMLARYELCGKGYEEAGRFLENIRKVTPEAIRKMCKQSMRDYQFVLLGKPETLQVQAFMY